jgi:O-antigen/teichoic acid export membrane protein
MYKLYKKPKKSVFFTKYYWMEFEMKIKDNYPEKSDLVTFLNPFSFLGLGESGLIARKSFLIFLNILVGSVLGYVALYFILQPQYMGAEQYGVIGFGIAYVGMFAFITDFGFNTTHIKRVSEGQDLGKCIGTFFIIKMVLIALMTGTVLVSIAIWKYVLGRGFQSPEHESVIYVFILYYALVSIATIPIGTFAARRETAKQQISSLLDPLIRVPLAIIIAINSLGVFALAGSYVIGIVGLLIASLFLFRKYPFGKFDSKIFRSYIKFALPISVSSTIGIISLNIDKVMIQLFWNSTLVGYYFGVQKLTGFIVVMSVSVTALLFPTLSAHHGKNEYKEIRNLTKVAERYVSLIVVPCVALIIVFSKPILNIISSDIADGAYTIFRLLAIYSLLLCFYKIFSHQIFAIDQPKLIAKIGVSMAGLNIALNLLLIPKDIRSLGINLFGMGAEGAALASAISIGYGLVMTKIYTRKLTGTKWNPRILLHLLAAVVMGIILFYISDIISINRWYELGMAGLLGFGIYFGLLWILRELKKEDLNLFLDIINPRGMKRYVVSELRGKNEIEEEKGADEEKEKEGKKDDEEGGNR